MNPPPNRLAIDPASPHYAHIYLSVGVRFKGEERKDDVYEYSVDEGWIIVPMKKNGKVITERGKPRTIKLHGTVEPYWKD